MVGPGIKTVRCGRRTFFDATREEKNDDFSSRNGALTSNNGDFN